MWIEEEENVTPTLTREIVDLAFSLDCRALPLDHCAALSQAIEAALPWFATTSEVGLHLIHGAESGNGWQRPDAHDSLLYLSKRAKLTLRLPRALVSAAEALTGRTLDVGGYPLTVGAARSKPLSRTPILFARHVLSQAEQSESDFLEHAVAQLRALGIQCRKVMPGRSHCFHTPTGDLFTRSLLVADLALEDALTLQCRGIGEGRRLGCGLFIAHKDIKTVRQGQEESA